MAAKIRDEYAYRDKLPFMDRSSCWWSVKPSDEYERDFATGRDYALQFWKVCGKHGNMGLDLSQILLELHAIKRPRRRYRSGMLARDNLSGVEIGFIRTVGDLFQASMCTTVLVASGHKRFAKRDFPKKSEIRSKSIRAAGLVGILATQFHCGTVRPDVPAPATGKATLQ